MLTFKEILQKREIEGKTKLYSAYEAVYEKAILSWQSTMGTDFKGSYTGIPHTYSVLRHIDNATTDEFKESLTSTEIFILLCSVLLHDIGKQDGKSKKPYKIQKWDNTKNNIMGWKNLNNDRKIEIAKIFYDPENKKDDYNKFINSIDKYENLDRSTKISFIKFIEKKVNLNKIIRKYHNIYSSLKIQSEWYKLRIPTEDHANAIALISCSHVWDDPNNTNYDEGLCGDPERCKFYCKPNPFHGLSDIRIIDEETVHIEWIAALLRLGDEVDNCKLRDDAEKQDCQHWRDKIDSIVFDRDAHCIKLKTRNILISSHGEGDPRAEWTLETVGYLQSAMESINKILSNWKNPLEEMGLSYECALLEIKEDHSALIGAGGLPIKKGEDGKKIEKKNEIKCTIEPSLRFINFEKLRETMEDMNRSVIGPLDRKYTPFSWESLAAARGIEDISLLKMALKRMILYKDLKNKSKCNYICKEKYESAANFDFSDGNLVFNEKIWFFQRPPRHNTNSKKDSKENPYPWDSDNLSIPTNIDELDYLLYPEHARQAKEKGKNKEENEDEDFKGGFYLPLKEKNGENGKEKRLSPVIAVEGGSGQGKTILALQIASNLVGMNIDMKEENTSALDEYDWTVLFFSLEQTPNQLKEQIKGFKAFSEDLNIEDPKVEDRLDSKIIDFTQNGWYEVQDVKSKLLFPHLSHLPYDINKDNQDLYFERRLQELNHALEWISKYTQKCFVVLDSLTACMPFPLKRNQIHQLINVVLEKNFPFLFTLERQKSWSREMEHMSFHLARYLADIVIKLDNETLEDYFRQTVEITKTKYNRHILGKHLLKLKSPRQRATRNLDPRTGIVVYRSIHNYIVSSRDEDKNRDKTKEDQIAAKKVKNKKEDLKQKNPGKKDTVEINISKDDIPLGESVGNQKQKIPDNSCFVISGPFGGHKFALAMNLLLRLPPTIRKEDQEDNKDILIISLLEEKEMKLGQVAYLKKLKAWNKKLKDATLDSDEQKKKSKQKKREEKFQGTKIREKILEIKGCGTKIHILTFQLGKIMPEEFLYIFEKYLKDNQTIGSFLFADTAQLRTRFPMLCKESLFLPTLIDVVKNHGIYSVFIDVTDDSKKEKDQETLALLAAADYRLMIDTSGECPVIKMNNVRGKIYTKSRTQIIVDEETDPESPILSLKKKEQLHDKENQNNTVKKKKSVQKN